MSKDGTVAHKKREAARGRDNAGLRPTDADTEVKAANIIKKSLFVNGNRGNNLAILDEPVTRRTPGRSDAGGSLADQRCALFASFKRRGATVSHVA
jgi:hypothetical protein